MLKEIPLKTSKDIRIQFLTNLNKIVFFNLKTDKKILSKNLNTLLKIKIFSQGNDLYKIKSNQ